MNRHHLDLPVPPDTLRSALRQAVEEWGGGFGDEQGPDEFAVPIRAGIRQGYARFRSAVEPTGSGSRLTLEVADQTLQVNRSAVMILLLGALGGIVTMLWPLHDSLLSFAPIGAVLALLAWLMVASRFRSHGPEELLATVEEIAVAGDEVT